MDRMKLPKFEDAQQHPHYQLSINRAIQRAINNPGDVFNIYYDNVAIFVRAKESARPRFSLKVCDVHKEGDNIKINYFNGTSELINEDKFQEKANEPP